MKFAKTLRFTVRVREFETVQIEVGAEISNYDIGLEDERLAGLIRLKPSHKEEFTKQLEELVSTEVNRLAREELEKISTWSEFSPNLADDYLGSDNGRTKKNPATRRLHR